MPVRGDANEAGHVFGVAIGREARQGRRAMSTEPQIELPWNATAAELDASVAQIAADVPMTAALRERVRETLAFYSRQQKGDAAEH